MPRLEWVSGGDDTGRRKKKIFPNFEAAAAVKNLLRLEKKGGGEEATLKNCSQYYV